MARLLMVDDEPLAVKALMAGIQEKMPHIEIYFAPSAVAAMALLRQYAFDVVVTDVRMPQMTGLELLERIHTTWPDCQVIILTAYDAFEYAYEAARYDHVRYLLKLEEPDVIVENVQQAFERHRELMEQRRSSREMRQYIADMQPLMQRAMLDRIFRYGDELPSPEVCASIGLKLRADEKLLLVMTTAMQEDALQLFCYGAVESLSAHGMDVTAYQTAQKACLILQMCEGREEEEPVAFVRTCLDDICEHWSDGNATFSVAMADSFVPVLDAKRIWEVMDAATDRLSGAGQVIGVDAYSQPMSAFPSPADVETLHNLLVRGEITKFFITLRQGVARHRRLSQSDRRRISTILEILLTDRFASEMLNQALAQTQLPMNYWYSSQMDDEWFDQFEALLRRLFALQAQEKNNQQLLLVKEVNAYIREHLSEPLTLTQVADDFHYNSSYLSRLYKTETGEGFNEHVSRLRVEEACGRLRRTDDTLSRIASECGFQTTKYFSAAFKRLMGVTPSEYRQGRDS